MQANRKMGVRLSLRRAVFIVNDGAPIAVEFPQTDEQGQQAHPKGGQQVVQNFHTELHTVGVHDHGGHHQIDQQVGKGLLALRFEHAGFHSGDAGAHEQKQHDDLTGRDLCEFHCGFLHLCCI